MTWARCWARLGVLDVEEDARAGRGAAGARARRRHAGRERALDSGDGEWERLRARRRWPGRSGSDGLRCRLRHDHAPGTHGDFRLLFLLDAGREALLRVFLRLPSRFELVVTVASV